MSDLIERIEKCSASEKRDMEGNPDPEGFRSGMLITAEDADAILYALKTMREIESIKRDIYAIEYAGQWMVTTPLGVYAHENLSLAVDAAVGASEKGEKR